MSLLVECHAVDAYFTVDARLVVHIILVDTMIHDVPLVLSWNLEYGIVCGSIDAILRFLFDDKVMVLIYIDWAKG